jgi:CBS domain-containing protein
VRRLPVVNRDKRLVGMVSLGDLAKHSPAAHTGEALRGISKLKRAHKRPDGPTRLHDARGGGRG